MASKSYGWDVRNIAKISPKMVKKRAIFRLQKKIPKPTPLPHMRLWFMLFQQFFRLATSMTSLEAIKKERSKNEIPTNRVAERVTIANRKLFPSSLDRKLSSVPGNHPKMTSKRCFLNSFTNLS